jgi:hypothetical protein
LRRLPLINSFPESPHTWRTDVFPIFGVAIIVNPLPSHRLPSDSGTAPCIDSRFFALYSPRQYLSNESLYMANERFPDFWCCHHWNHSLAHGFHIISGTTPCIAKRISVLESTH